MSLLEEARMVRQRIAARLRELEPMVREYEELQRVAAEMGIDDAEVDAAPAPPAAAPAEPATPRRSQRNRRRKAAERTTQDDTPEPGDLGGQVLDAVHSDPGKSIADYARMLEVPQTALYRPVRELTNDGKIVKRARLLFPS